MDDYGPNTDPIRVSVDITIAGDRAVVDFSRSSDQVPAGLNCYINYTRAYAMFAIRIFAGVDVPHNEGVTRPIDIVAREGSFFNAKYPAAGGGRATVQIRIYDAMNGALAQAKPARAMGAFSHWANPNFGGVDSRTGAHFVAYDLIFGGFGARVDSDGPEGLCPVFNCANIPVEVHETNNPVRVRTLEFIPDSGGAGLYRGGCGMRKDIEVLDDCVVTLLGDRHTASPYGIGGGAPGRKGETLLISGGTTRALGSKEVCRLTRGDIVSFRLAGAGGYGEARSRERARVRADVRNGFVTREQAVAVYGASDEDLA
jgi:N-methylhydantoinase B